MIKKVTFFLILFSTLLTAKAQDSIQNGSFSFNADLVSRYLWRGQLYSPAFNVQPYASITKGQFTFGTWGSYALDNTYAEIDFYISWQYKNFGLTVSDYCTLDEISGESQYFNFRKTTTAHAIEGTASLALSEAFPLTLTASTFFYGSDRDSSGNLYSTYLELSYPFSKGGYEFNVFAGGTPGEGLYGTKAGLVNVGFSAGKVLKITDHFEIPVSIQMAANPLANNLFMVFSLTL